MRNNISKYNCFRTFCRLQLNVFYTTSEYGASAYKSQSVFSSNHTMKWDGTSTTVAYLISVVVRMTLQRCLLQVDVCDGRMDTYWRRPRTQTPDHQTTEKNPISRYRPESLQSLNPLD